MNVCIKGVTKKNVTTLVDNRGISLYGRKYYHVGGKKELIVFFYCLVNFGYKCNGRE